LIRPAVLIVLVAPFLHAGLPADSLYTAVLRDHVIQGRVNYRGIKNDDRFWMYIESLRKSSPDEIVDTKARLAYWINVYNAFTIKLVCDHYPIESIKDLNTGSFLAYLFSSTAWDKEVVTLADKTLTLNRIEHEIIRPQYNDPRIHYALVCAARSCPPLRPEAYSAERLESQLDDQATAFIRDRARNVFDPAKSSLMLSSIFKWYATDFGGSDAALIEHIVKYLPDDQARTLRDVAFQVKITYLDYDWRLND
jgi:hypothetical protein